MNEKHMQYVLTVLKEGSFTNAAKKLYVSQPSLSQIIKTAESNLGAPIFDRSTDPITLTPAGQLYVEAARQVTTISTNLRKQVEELSKEEFGTICLGISVQRGMELLPELYPRFKKRFPHVGLELQEEQLVLIVNRECELAKRIAPGTPIDILEARDETFISSQSGHSVRTIQDSLFITRDMKPKIDLVTISIEVGKHVVAASPVVMACPDSYVETDNSPDSAYYSYPILGVENPRHFYACYRKDMYLTKYMKGFLEILHEI